MPRRLGLLLVLTLACACRDDAPVELDAAPRPDAARADATSGDAPASPTDASALDGAIAASIHFPGASSTWQTIAPETLGWDATKLGEALDYAGQHATKAIVLLWNGRILAERYWGVDSDTYRRDIASAQKSIVSLLVGIAVERGLVSLDDRVSDRLGDGWSAAGLARERAIRLRHLVTMTSGLDDALAFVAAPGTVWRYNNSAYQQVHPFLEAALGKSMQDVSTAWLFQPLGMTSGLWYERKGMTDPDGDPLAGLVLSVRDLARVGILVQARGLWNDARVVPAAYLDAALRPSQELNESYGYLWWLNGQASHRLPGPNALKDGPLFPGAPPDVVAALGKDDQKLYVSRALGLVLARLGESAGPRAQAVSGFDSELWRRVMAAAPKP